ncbi:protein LAZY 1-like isoform X2 [Sesamum indicum]|uniref:Protein LAZY 1-like isoform X2 n=1 Tax=Sesamum indicum TaxID=4182 RepID=A0A8M8V5J1_SESIN|nr:protein LAZY 1-like isoform X2 [Sesamum indicum]
MKLLAGWMHRKQKHNTTDPIKNSTLVQTLSDEQNYYVEPTEAFSHPHIKRKRCSNIFEGSKVEGLCQEESFEPFEFLSIGTFGMELLNTDPPTPTLPMPIEKLSDGQIEITENDLNLINYELEKFLEAEETEVEYDTSGRSSQASIITLSYSKPIEGAAGSEGQVHMVACPLQSYLFAASVEVANYTDKKVTYKKERTSLEELFKRNNIVHDDPPMKKSCEGPEHKARTRNHVAHLMKKVVKKFRSSSTNDTSAASGTKAIKENLSKTLVKMFHKKVYPEEMSEKQYVKLAKAKKKNSGSNKSGDESGSKKSKKKSTTLLCWNGICRGASPENGGHWIKTDSDYLVLEL